MKQYPDGLQWQNHFEEHIGRLDGTKAPRCPHSREQCAEAFELEQELRFYLQDDHYVKLRKALKQSSPGNETNTKPRKRRSSIDDCRHILTLEPKFHINNRTNLWTRRPNYGCRLLLRSTQKFQPHRYLQMRTTCRLHLITQSNFWKTRQAAITMHG